MLIQARRRRATAYRPSTRTNTVTCMHDFIVEEIYVSTDFVYFLNNKASKQETEIRPPKTKRRLTENKLYIFKYP